MDVQDEYACPSFVVNTENYLYSIWTISESPGLYSLYEKVGIRAAHLKDRKWTLQNIRYIHFLYQPIFLMFDSNINR